MSRTISVADLTLACREAADMVGSTFRTDAQILSMLNTASPELWGLLLDSYGDEYLRSSRTFSTVAGTSSYAIEDPSGTGANIFKILRVLVDFGSNRMHRCERFNPDERSTYLTSNQNWLGVLPRYFATGSNIEFEYAPQSVHSVTIVFVPCAPVLVAGSNVDGYNGWERYIIAKVGAQLLAAEESDPTALLMEVAALKARIESEKKHRDVGNPPMMGVTRAGRGNWRRRID